MINFFKDNGDRIDDVRICLGKVTLVSGVAEVTIPNGRYRNWYAVSITPDSSSASYRYSIDYHSNGKFVIHSSDSGDSTEVRWMAIGY